MLRFLLKFSLESLHLNGTVVYRRKKDVKEILFVMSLSRGDCKYVL